MFFVSLCILALLPLSAVTQSLEECQTPNKTVGHCISIKECPVLLQLLLNRRNESTVRQYLQSSRCLNVTTGAFVCCPQTNQVEDRSASIFPKLLAPPECGLPTTKDRSKIQGGTPSEPGAWPWAAALGYQSKNSTNSITYQCGGSIISKTYVLTAGHCINSSTHDLKNVRVGDINLSSTNAVDYEVDQVFLPQAYSPFLNDIALIKLKKPVEFNDNVKPVCLPKTAQLRNQTFEKTSPFIIGWGAISWKGPKSPVLMQAQVPVVANDACKKRWAEISQSAVITPGHICAGYKSGNKDSCTGDSGGPMMIPEGKHYYVVGVVSYGVRCGEPNTPAIYTKVSEYIDWINSIIE